MSRTSRTCVRISYLAPLVLLWACERPTVPADDRSSSPRGGQSPPSADTADTGTATDHLDDTAEQIEGTGDGWFFEQGVVREFVIELDQQDYNSLQNDPYSYVEAEFVVEDQTLTGVGVRLKGESTYRPISGKPSFKIKFDYVDDEQRLHDKNRLTLHNMIYDPSMMTESLGYRVFRDADLPASRTGYANVWINDRLYGLYAIIETLDEDFVQRWWDDPEGMLYEVSGGDYSSSYSFEMEEMGDEADPQQLRELCKAMQAQGEELYTSAQEHFDWEQVSLYLATEAAIGHWDGYSLNVNNWWIYWEPSTDAWHYIPWSVDLSWAWNPWSSGTYGNYGASPDDYDQGMLVSRCHAYTPCKEDLRARISELADHLETYDFDALVDEHVALLAEHVYADMKKEYSNMEYDQHVEGLRDFTTGRVKYLRDYLERTEPPE